MFEKKCNRQLQLKNVDRKASKEEGVGSRQDFGTLSMVELSNTSSNNDSTTSADDDEDDGTSDGELASMDKEDHDESNSEQSLASKVCTFTTSGS